MPSPLGKNSYKPTVEAHRRLAAFTKERKANGDWFEGEDFAGNLALFYDALLQAPNCGAEDLVRGSRGIMKSFWRGSSTEGGMRIL